MRHILFILFLFILGTSFGQKEHKYFYFLNVNIDTTIQVGTKDAVGQYLKGQKGLKPFFNDSVYMHYHPLKIIGVNDVRYPDTTILFGDTTIRHKLSSNIHKNKNKESVKNNSQITFDAEIHYLFYWSEDNIIMIAYEATKNFRLTKNYTPVRLSKVMKKRNKYLVSSPSLRYRRVNKDSYYPVNYQFLLINGLNRQLSNGIDDLNNDMMHSAGVYWLFPGDTIVDKGVITDPQDSNLVFPTIFMVVDNQGQKHFIKPIKYWIFMSYPKASRFKKKVFGEGMGAGEVVLLALKKSSNPQLRRTGLLLEYQNKHIFYLVAIGRGDRKTIQQPKWKKLLDYHVFGNYKCMIPSTYIPSKRLFRLPPDSLYDKKDTSNFKNLRVRILQRGQVEPIIGAFFGWPKPGREYIQLLKKIDCTALFGINHVDFSLLFNQKRGTIIPEDKKRNWKMHHHYWNVALGSNTVNNLVYLPGVYFLPEYFTVKSINGLPIKEFVEKQCKN